MVEKWASQAIKDLGSCEIAETAIMRWNVGQFLSLPPILLRINHFYAWLDLFWYWVFVGFTLIKQFYFLFYLCYLNFKSEPFKD